MEKVTVILESYRHGGYMLYQEDEDGTEYSAYYQSDWDFPNLAISLGCPWDLDAIVDTSRAIEAAYRWLDSNEGEIQLPVSALDSFNWTSEEDEEDE